MTARCSGPPELHGNDILPGVPPRSPLGVPHQAGDQTLAGRLGARTAGRRASRRPGVRLAQAVQRGQEIGDRRRDLRCAAARQVMADLAEKLHAGIGQGRGQLVRRADRDERVVRVGDQQRRLRDARQGRGEAAQLVDQRPLLGQETAPHRPVVVVGVTPDVPVHMLVGGDGPSPQPGDGGQPGPGQPGSKPPRRHRAHLPGHRGRQQPVPAGQAVRADAGQQDQRLDPFRGQLGHGQRHAAPVGVADQDRAPDAPRVQRSQDGAGAVPEAPGGLVARPVPGPVQRYHVERGRQLVSNLLPVRGRTRLAVQQHDLMPAHTGELRWPAAAGSPP